MDLNTSYNAQFTSKYDMLRNQNEEVQKAALNYIEQKMNFEDEYGENGYREVVIKNASPEKSRYRNIKPVKALYQPRE